MYVCFEPFRINILMAQVTHILESVKNILTHIEVEHSNLNR